MLQFVLQEGSRYSNFIHEPFQRFLAAPSQEYTLMKKYTESSEGYLYNEKI